MVNHFYLECLLFTFLLLQFQVTDANPKFTANPSNPSYFDKGSTAKLVWDYNDPQDKVNAVLFQVRQAGTYVGMLVKQKDKVFNATGLPAVYMGRVKIEGIATLVIENITSQDSTDFICVLDVGRSRVSSMVQVIVTERPNISPTFEVNKDVKEGDGVNIICAVTGNPIPTVIWIQKGTHLTKSIGGRKASLTFKNISRSDAGNYVCRANNSVGSIQKELTIRVNYKPEGTTLMTNGDQDTVIQGGAVTFFCKVAAAEPQVSMYKFYLNNSLVSESNISRYTIKNVNRSKHHGRYKCVPCNVVGDGQEASVTLFVQVPVQFTEVPQNITVNVTNGIFLRCAASGYPVPNITWKKLGKKLSDQRQLIILRSKKSDAGVYLCSSGNGVGNEKTARAHVTVQYPPTIQTVSTSSNKSWIGQTVTLKCQSDGVPVPTLTWYKPDGSELYSIRARQNEVRVILTVDQEFGVYKCLAANGLFPYSQRVIEINQITKPGQASIKLSESNIQATFLTISWTTPADDGGSPITAYRVIMLKGDTEIGHVIITNPKTTTSSFSGLNKDTSYTVKVFSRNFVFEGDPVVQTIKTKFEGAPDVVKINELPGETTDDTVILKWKEPASNGKIITKYKVYQRVVTDGKVGEWTEVKTIRDVSVRELEIELERGKVYQFAVTAANELGESLKQDKENILQIKAGDSPTKGSRAFVDNGMSTTIFAGAAVAGGLLIIGVIVIIFLWKRRKRSNGEDDEMSMDGRGSANHYEASDGYQEVSRAEAAQRLQASGPEDEANYAQVDMTKKKMNRPPPSDEYAQVDKSKRTKNRPKRPGELDYAELGDLRATLVPGPSGATAAAAVVRPPVYEGTDYADITQFGVSQPDPTYANVSKGDVTYSNMQSIT